MDNEHVRDSDKGKPDGSDGWLRKIDAALKREKEWREDAARTLERYSLESSDAKAVGRYNILWSNTEVLRQAIYNQPPKPDIRQRWQTKDPAALACAEVLDRSLTYAIDAGDFDLTARRCCLDYLLPGRAVVRLRYAPEFDSVETGPGGESVETLAAENVVFENVPWNDFVHGDAKAWENVEWIAFRHYVDRKDADKLFPDKAARLDYSMREGGDGEEGREGQTDTADAGKDELKAVVWEIWDRRGKAVLWVSRGVDAVLSQGPPPLDLAGFWPIARPLLAVDRPDTLTPMPLYMQYREQAAELDKVSGRIQRMVSAIKFRGLYDAAIGNDLARLLSEAEDGSMVPTDNALAYMERGGLAGAIFFMPIVDAAAVLDRLYQSREATKNAIYEITGISDVIRGATNPNETATAQQIKAAWGSSRVDGMRRELQRFFRETLVIAAEIQAEYVQSETLAAMTGSTYPSGQEKQAAIMALQSGQEDPKAAAVARQPSWEEIRAVMRSDLLRSFKIDIETDSTIAPNQQQEMKALAETMQMIGNLMGQVIPGVQNGVVPPQLALSLLSAVIRRTPLANEMTALLDQYEEELASGNPLQNQVDGLKKENEGLKKQLEDKQGELQIKAADVQGRQRTDMAELQLRAADMAQRREDRFAQNLPL